MSDTKHTPGPWKYSADFSENGDRYTDFSIYAGDMNVIGACGSCGLPTICSEANARLIAAAPELLEALSSLTAVLGLKPKELSLQALQEAYDIARAAIAKAQGEQA